MSELCHGGCGRPVRDEGPLLSWLEDVAGTRLYCVPCGFSYLIGQYKNGRELEPDDPEYAASGPSRAQS